MKIVIAIICSILPFSAMAGWQLTTPHSDFGAQPFVQAGPDKPRIALNSARGLPKNYVTLGKPPNKVRLILLKSQSLRENLGRLVKGRWVLKWKSEIDYPITSNANSILFTGPTFANALEKIMVNYPKLKATLFMKNHVIWITQNKAVNNE